MGIELDICNILYDTKGLVFDPHLGQLISKTIIIITIFFLVFQLYIILLRLLLFLLWYRFKMFYSNYFQFLHFTFWIAIFGVFKLYLIFYEYGLRLLTESFANEIFLKHNINLMKLIKYLFNRIIFLWSFVHTEKVK